MKIVLQLLIFIFTQNILSSTMGCAPFECPCDRLKKGTVLEFNPKINHLQKVYRKKEDMERYDSDREYDEYVNNANCSYVFSRTGNKDLLLYSDICAKIEGDVYYFYYSSDMGDEITTRVALPSKKFKNVHEMVSPKLHNISQFECNDDSKKYIKSIEKTATKELLMLNNFKLVENNADSKNSYLFYASPGIVIKTKKESTKCKLKDKCKLEVIYKKELFNSIFDINKNLTTNDKL